MQITLWFIKISLTEQKCGRF